jgi:hypothetical protein
MNKQMGRIRRDLVNKKSRSAAMDEKKDWPVFYKHTEDRHTSNATSLG